MSTRPRALLLSRLWSAANIGTRSLLIARWDWHGEYIKVILYILLAIACLKTTQVVQHGDAALPGFTMLHYRG